MDRAHRIGQENPVLVLRLAAANSVDGRMLKRANSKLMLERLVIRKGAFIADDAKKGAAGLSNEELMELLKDTIPLKDEPQSGVVSDKVRSALQLVFLLELMLQCHFGCCGRTSVQNLSLRCQAVACNMGSTNIAGIPCSCGCNNPQ